MNDADPLRFSTPPESIVKKEQELSALLARVLDAPLGPVREALDDLRMSTARIITHLNGLVAEVGEIDERVFALRKSMAQVLERHDLLHRHLDEAFGRREQAEENTRDAITAVYAAVKDVLAETARATQLADDAAASAGRDRELLDTYRAAWNEAQRAAQTAASRGRVLLWLIVTVLVAVCADVAISIAGFLRG